MTQGLPIAGPGATLRSMANPELTHQDFVELYKAGKLAVHIDQSAAMHVCDRDPRIDKSTKAAHHFWKNVGCLIPLLGIGSFFFIKWYWALAIIFFGVGVVFPALRKSAAQFVLKAALEDEMFFYDMVAANVIRYSASS